MKYSQLLLATLVVLSSAVVVDGKLYAEESEPEGSRQSTQYLVELSEFKLEGPIPLNLDESEVVETIFAAGTKPVETIRLTATAETESFVQTGRRSAVVTAKMTQGGTTTNQTEYEEVGAILRVRIKPTAQGAIANIDYSTNRIDSSGTDNLPPDILTSTTQSVLLYSFGKPRLLSTVGSEELIGIIVTVREIK